MKVIFWKLKDKILDWYRGLSTLAKTLIIIILILTMVGFVWTWQYLFGPRFNENLTTNTKVLVHYVARYTTKYDTTYSVSNDPFVFAKFHEIVLQHYLTNLEAEYPNFSFELRTHDNKSDAELSKDIYRKIISDSGIIPFIVIDNTWGAHIRECEGIIREAQIPVISLNADHNNLDFGKNAVFIGGGDNSPRIISRFISQILKEQKINFISETNFDLHQIYKEQFQANNLKVANEISLKYSDADISKEDSLKFITEFNSKIAPNKDFLVVLDVHSTWGSFILNLINSKYDNIRIVSPIYSTSRLTEQLGASKANEFITMTSGEDAVSKKIKEEIEFFRNSKDSLLFDRINIHEFLKRCTIATDILEDYVANNVEFTKTDLVRFIQNLPNNPVVNERDVYSFKKKKNVIELNRELTFSTFKKGQLIAFPLQLDEKQNPIPNLFFGMEIESIHGLNLKTEKYGIDFYYWLKVDTSYVNIEEMVNFSNLKIESKSALINRRIENSSFVYKLYKVSALGSQEFNLEEYPFDEHLLKLSAQILDPKTKMRISFDQSSLSSEEDILNKINLDNWNAIGHYVTVDNIVAKSSKGLVFDDITNKYKSISFWIRIKRGSFLSILGLILPILIIGFIAIGMLFLKDQTFSNIGEAIAGLLVSTLLFSISLIELTPSTDVLKKTDWIFGITLIIVLTNFIVLVFHNSIFVKGERKPVITRYVGYFMLLIYPISILFILFF